jgi:hypothetical protein
VLSFVERLKGRWSGGKRRHRCAHAIEDRGRALSACAPIHLRIGRRRLGRPAIHRPIVDRALVDSSSRIRAGITDQVAEGVPFVCYAVLRHC